MKFPNLHQCTFNFLNFMKRRPNMTNATLSRGWSRYLIWGSVELRHVEDQTEAPPWLVEVLTERWKDRVFCYDSFLLFIALNFSDSISKMSVFLFLPFLNLGAQIRCPQDRYTNPKSALHEFLHPRSKTRKTTGKTGFKNCKLTFCN